MKKETANIATEIMKQLEENEASLVSISELPIEQVDSARLDFMYETEERPGRQNRLRLEFGKQAQTLLPALAGIIRKHNIALEKELKALK